MRLLLVTHFYPPEIGAPQRRLRAFVRHWRAHGVDVRVVTALPHYPDGTLAQGFRAGYGGGRSGEFGEHVVRVPFLPIGPKGGGWKLLDHLAVAGLSLVPSVLGARPDVVLVTVPTLPSLAVGWGASRRWGVPLVIEMRDAWPDLLLEEEIGMGRAGRMVASVVTRAQRRADAVVSVSGEFASVLADRGLDPNRLHHIPNGVDLDVVPMLPEPDHGPRLRVLYLGTHGVSQDLSVAVRAIAALGPDDVEARFVGAGTEKRSLRDLARRLGAAITFEDPIPTSALWECYRWADTCLVPLRDWGPFRYTVPSKLYEIMACGRHVTASVAGEAARIVKEAAAGVVVPPGDDVALAAALADLVRDRSAASVGGNPRQWVADHAAYDRLADRYLAIFRALQL